MKGSHLLLGVMWLVLTTRVMAMTYGEALGQAVGHDKQYAAAIYEAQSSEYLPVIGRAGLLPKLSLSGFQASNALTQANQDFLGNPNTSSQRYLAQSLAGQLTQPLINLAALAAYLQSKSQASASQQKLAISFSELASNVAGAYYGLASARESYAYTKKEVKNFDDQERVIHVRRLNGAASSADLEEIRYAKMQALVTLDEVRNDIEQASISLEKLLGRKIADSEILQLPAKDDIIKEKLETLMATGIERNPKILYQKQMHESARLEHKKNQASYAPTLDLVGYQGYQNSNTLSTIGQKSKQGYLGLQFNVPIFDGGEAYGKERQSALFVESQRMVLESEIGNVVEGIKKAYTQAKISSEKLNTLRQQLSSANFLYKSFQEQNALGLKSTYELLSVARKKFQCEREIAKTTYEKALAIKHLEIMINRGVP